MSEVRPGDPEFEEMLTYLDNFLDGLDSQRRTRLETEEHSMKRFITIFLEVLSRKLGYVLVGVLEFVKDLSASAKTGWRAGAARARGEALRNYRDA